MILRRKKNKQHSLFAVSQDNSLQRSKPRRQYHWKLWLGIAFFVLVLTGATYLIFFSPVFKIREIQIRGSSLIPADKIEEIARSKIGQKIFNLIPKDTLSFLTEGSIKSAVLAAFPEISSIEIQRTQKNTLDVTIEERKTAAVLCLAKVAVNYEASDAPVLAIEASSTAPVAKQEALPQAERCFFVDDQSIVYREAPEISATMLPTFYSQDQELCQLRKQAILPATIQFAMQLKKELRALKIDLIAFALDEQPSTEIRAYTSEGWMIYFDTGRPAAIQAKVLEVLLSDQIKENRAYLQYVDLRVENRAYYK